MKKVNNLLYALIALFAATFITPVKAQVFETGDVLIEGYYGFPNLYTSVLKAAYVNDNSIQEDVKIGGIGPIGFRAEYMVTDKIGMGIDINYTNTYVSWSEDYTGINYNYEISVPRFRAMGKFNFHFTDSDVFDAYGSVGAGYSSWKYKLDTNDPFYTDTEQSSLIPVAFRLAVGARYFFTDNVGANLEFGLGGGSIIHAGLSYKL